jgi:hypothetical protein
MAVEAIRLAVSGLPVDSAWTWDESHEGLAG